MPFEPIVDQNKCKGCEECLEVCTTGVFEIRDGKYLSLSPEKCTGCESCLEVCKEGAITVQESKPALSENCSFLLRDIL